MATSGSTETNNSNTNELKDFDSKVHNLVNAGFNTERIVKECGTDGSDIFGSNKNGLEYGGSILSESSFGIAPEGKYTNIPNYEGVESESKKTKKKKSTGLSLKVCIGFLIITSGYAFLLYCFVIPAFLRHINEQDKIGLICDLFFITFYFSQRHSLYKNFMKALYHSLKDLKNYTVNKIKDITSRIINK